LAALGAKVHDTLAQAVRDTDIVVTMLEDGTVVESVLFADGLAQALQRGSLLIDMSSIQPAQARSHGQRLAALGVGYLDAPVSGGTLGAEAGNLAIMAGGSNQDFERGRAVLTHFGRPTLVGPTGSGQLAKLANQMIVGVTIGVVAEALLLCAKGGADMAKVKEAVTGGFADSRILQVHGQRMIERDFAPRGRISVQLKDMRNAMATAQELGFDAPITGLLEALYASASENGLSGMDQAAFFTELARRNGMA
jgi:2-hydroxy-3-oxopropionate reductase